MKKILFLLLMGLAFVGCADPNTNNNFTQLDTYFTGVSGDKTYTILASQNVIIYTETSASGAESFTFTLNKIGNEYKAYATMGRTAGSFDASMWNQLFIKTDQSVDGFEIRNPVVSVDDVDGQFTFTISGDYESSIANLTTNTTSIEAVFKGSSGDESYQLSEKFIAAIKNYFL